MTKEELQVKINVLETIISDANVENTKYVEQLASLKNQYADLSKPKLTPQQYDKLQLLIENAIESYDFDALDNYSIDYGIDYDNRVTCESFCFDNSGEIVRIIMENIEDMFAEATNEENQD